MTAEPPSVRILVCGAADRGDDGAALRAVARLLPRLEPQVRDRLEIRRCPQLAAIDLIDVRPEEACLILDTVVGVAPGAIVTFPLAELAARTDGVSPRSSHAVPIDEVLGIAEAARGTLPRGSFVGVGGKWFGFGELLSRAVRAALPALERAAEDEVRRLVAVTTA